MYLDRNLSKVNHPIPNWCDFILKYRRIFHRYNFYKIKSDQETNLQSLGSPMWQQRIIRHSSSSSPFGSSHVSLRITIENVNFTSVPTNSLSDKEISVTSVEAYKYEGNKDFELQSIPIEIKDAKNDQQRNSHIISFENRSDGYNSSKTFCIATTTFCWAIVSRPSMARHPFLPFPIEGHNDLSKRT